ncbi:MAG: VOC family protein [Aureibaculum sp.]|nr:VOC family protein [Aureibaculum sp.]
MKIDHLAIWVKDLEKMKDFYITYFNMKCGDKYVNDKKNFSSYFLSFNDGPRIELMYRPDISEQFGIKGEHNGLTHIAISVGNKGNVNKLTDLIRNSGFRIISEPRTTGDGYYESVIEDPERNLIEITE